MVSWRGSTKFGRPSTFRRAYPPRKALGRLRCLLLRAHLPPVAGPALHVRDPGSNGGAPRAYITRRCPRCGTVRSVERSTAAQYPFPKETRR